MPAGCQDRNELMNNTPAKSTDQQIVVIGAGPAGLAATHHLALKGRRPVLIEKTAKSGGLARTETYRSYHFDIGGHRFFTKMSHINRLWQDMLGSDFIKVSRKSRIFYKGRFYDYPLNLVNTLTNLGIKESVLIMASYLRTWTKPRRVESTFEQWVSNRFGKRLYETFFKTYTEKVWGMPCSQIQADWAAQRIKGLSLTTAVANAVFGSQQSKTLIHEFHYPREGPSMMWEKFVDRIAAHNGDVLFKAEATRIHHQSGKVTGLTYEKDGQFHQVRTQHLISSAPITRLIDSMTPEPPDRVCRAAQRLSYRSFVIVILIVDKKNLFPDQWLYIHNPDVKVGRIQNFKNWSVDMVPDPEKTSVGMEYFCNQEDDFWRQNDENLVRIASRELAQIGLAQRDEIRDHYIVRQPAAYPVYDPAYDKHLTILRDYLRHFDNLQSIGRNGMHRYNNMDHSMQSGILAAENVMGADHDIWEINEDEKYLEG